MEIGKTNYDIKEAIRMFPVPPTLKDTKKGSGFGKIVKVNDSLRVQPQ